jgi:hypothetical protein
MRVIFLLAGFLLASSVAYAETNTITSTVTGTTTVDRTPPTASAPSIVNNNQDVCTTAASGAIQTQILGFATGAAITDKNCERLKLARSLYGMGMKVAAVSVLCQDERVWNGMLMAGTPCPYMGKIGKEASAIWEEEGKTLDRDVVGLPAEKPKKVTDSNNEEVRNEGFFAGLGFIAAFLLLLL